MNLTESYKNRLLKLSGIKEEFNVINNTLEISEPYDKIQKININGNIATVTRDGSVKYEESPKMIYSYEPFEYIINIIKIYSNHISYFRYNIFYIRILFNRKLYYKRYSWSIFILFVTDLLSSEITLPRVSTKNNLLSPSMLL